MDASGWLREIGDAGLELDEALAGPAPVAERTFSVVPRPTAITA
jgi:hypothetical protein